MNRRHFIQTSGLSLAALLLQENIFAGNGAGNAMLISFPDAITAVADGVTVALTGKGQQSWSYQNLQVVLKNTGNNIAVFIEAPGIQLSAVSLHWKTPVKNSSLILNDHWERTYGDISWQQPAATAILPWYFMEHNGTTTNGFGVKTGTASFCAWQISNEKLSLTMDTRSGGEGVQLGDRKLKAAEIVTIKNNTGESAFETGKRFMKLMCAKARMPAQPVYGINDWYFTYGNNSEKLILEHTQLMEPMAAGLSNRPFSVIDAGWFMQSPASPGDNSWGDVSKPNQNFGDMSSLAAKLKKTGMRPGLWTRPLCSDPKDAVSLTLPYIKGRDKKQAVLDPSIPENMERVKNYFKLYKQWGYELVKFDYTSADIFGKWGFEMLRDKTMTVAGWKMNDSSKTNAEIVLHFYKSIREAAGDMYIIGCNTFSHLSAGLFELNRIGDDTSGNEWSRTKKMGVNTLAFRAVQHGAFYSCDGDCVGLTTKVPWTKNKQWMELLAKSGMPLFISAQPEATGTEQKEIIKKCFDLASKNLPVGEPLDWMENPFPKKWKLNNSIESFDWD
ncbi:alpha-amylase family protein [Ferruginibacter sp.]